jgi:hypothetical protein
MTKELMLSLLNSANTGDQMLAVLDTLTVADDVVEYKEPTMETIEF